jgi:hypothetical protein
VIGAFQRNEKWNIIIFTYTTTVQYKQNPNTVVFTIIARTSTLVGLMPRAREEAQETKTKKQNREMDFWHR